MSYDVIVVGAGPAGSITAATAASAGFRTLVLEKNSSCRSPCAGYVSRTINLELPEDCIIQSKVKTMRTYFPDLSFQDFQLDGLVVDRPSFDMALVMKAKESGAEIKWDSPLSKLIQDGVEFRGGKAFGKVIVGADGVFSKTAALLGMEKQRVAMCAQYHINGIRPLPETGEIFFDNNYAPGGYAWVYPTGEDSAKIGLGLTRGNPREYLDALIKESQVANRGGTRKKEYITGTLPVGGLREKLVINNVLLAGDSAGMADPITGAGINNAVLAGEVAGRTIIEALEHDDLEMLLNYEARIRRLLGRTMDRALEKRKRLDACVNNELLQEQLPELWVAFKRYWES